VSSSRCLGQGLHRHEPTGPGRADAQLSREMFAFVAVATE
jgi:hypothetical protein